MAVTLSPAYLQQLFTQYEIRFQAAWTVAEEWHSTIATEVPATTENWLGAWLGMTDKYRQWNGPRIVREPAPQTYFVTIYPYELTESIDRYKLEDDIHGVYSPLIGNMGKMAKKLPDYLLRDLIFNAGDQTGIIQNGLDGLTHWNTAHPVDYWDSSKGTYCNDFRGTFTINGVVTGGALTVNGFNTVWQAMSSRVSESGEALGLIPDLTVVPPQLKATAQTILQAQMIGAAVIGNLGTGSAGTANAPFVGSTENVLRGWTDLQVNPDFAGYPTDWLTLVTKGAVKPFGIAMRQAPNLVYRNRLDDPMNFDSHSLLIGSDARLSPMWAPAFLSSISSP